MTLGPGPAPQRLSQALAAALGSALGSAADAADDDGAALTVLPAARPTAPARLAQAHPGGAKARAQAQALYERCLAHYRSKVQRGLPQDDLGAAAAYFVLACLAALQDLDVREAQLALVERQMRRVIGRYPAWQQAGAGERQDLFEQFALLGVLVGESQFEARKQGAAARANVQRAARGYLQQLLGLNPDALRLGERGLAVELDTRALDSLDAAETAPR